VVRALELHSACPGIIAMLGWAVSAAALALVAHRNGGESWLVLGLFAMAGGLALLVVAVPACAAWHWHRVRGFFAPHALTADEAGVELASGSHSGRLPWSAIDRWRESPQQFLLYRHCAEFVVVPKHAFASVADLSAFKAILEAHLGPARRRGATATRGLEAEEWRASR
jgi:hypothetical protein